VVSCIFESFVDFFTLVTDVFQSWHFQGLVSLLEVIWERWPHFSFEKWFFPADHHVLDFLDVVFHFGDKLVNLKDVSHCVLNEWVNSLGVPFELIDTFREREVHFFDSIGKKWFLNWKESRENAIVSVGNDLKVTSLLSVGIYFLVK